MRLLIGVFVIFIFVSLSGRSISSSNELESLMDRGAYLFHTNRFLDSERVFQPLMERLKGSKPLSKEYYVSLYYLGMSMTEQGKTEGVKALFSERVDIGNTMFGRGHFESAKNILNLGEMYYREGKIDSALKYLDKAEEIYNTLSDKPEGFLKFIKANREEYSRGGFDRKKLREDFSLFYSACESLNVGEKYSKEKIKLKRYAETGVDFKLEGIYKGMFSANLLGGSTVIPDHDRRVVFIPRNDRTVYDEWCVIYVLNNKISGIELSEG